MVKPFIEVLIRMSPVNSEKLNSFCMTTELRKKLLQSKFKRLHRYHLIILAFSSLDIVIMQVTEEEQFVMPKIISYITISL